MNNSNLPQPTQIGSKVGHHIGAITKCFGIIPFFGVGIQIYIDGRFKQAQKIIQEKIAEGNIDLLDDDQYKYLIPNLFHFFESVKNGEEIHNLRIIAEIIFDKLHDPVQGAYAARNASRRLQTMSIEELKALVVCYKAFCLCKKEQNYKLFNGNYLWVTDKLFAQELGDSTHTGISLANEYLSEFLSRGFLYVNGEPGVMGTIAYFKTKYFDEIINAASKLKEKVA
jgi:hypothetical protein